MDLKNKIDQGSNATNPSQGQLVVKDAQNAPGRCISNGALNLDLHRGRMHFIINFGVAASRKKISLETLGKNIKDFRIPDERGN